MIQWQGNIRIKIQVQLPKEYTSVNEQKSMKNAAELPGCHEYQDPQSREPQDGNPSSKSCGTISSVMYKWIVNNANYKTNFGERKKKTA